MTIDNVSVYLDAGFCETVYRNSVDRRCILIRWRQCINKRALIKKRCQWRHRF
ncbi:hypothetical protein HMPREF0454_00484 [Hafnia alvei ATCC 51873]|uniref:Uncharacterized protein n=1 Tax=Hafnia alvei ATCC 51873 TaxID=1002364 RepID=G9Y1R7_HAFAL|nr:hypothetical protein HMPREF0454_00484 [Hafnia alvei ATCC 51873]